MQKSAAHVSKALALDVPADAGTGAEVNPILRPLRTLGTRLALKTDVYRVAETSEERAILLLEQARTDRRVPLKKQLLEQVTGGRERPNSMRERPNARASQCLAMRERPDSRALLCATPPPAPQRAQPPPCN